MEEGSEGVTHQKLEYYVREFDQLGREGFTEKYPLPVLIQVGCDDFTEAPSAKFQDETISTTPDASDIESFTGHTLDDLVVPLDFEQGRDYNAFVEVRVEKARLLRKGKKTVREKVQRTLKELRIGRASNLEVTLNHKSVGNLHALLLYDGEAKVVDGFYIRPFSPTFIYRQDNKGEYEMQDVPIDNRTGTKIELVKSVIVIGEYKFRLYDSEILGPILISQLPALRARDAQK